MNLDIGLAALIPLLLAPQAAQRLKRAAVWCWLMGWAVALASVFARRRA